MSVARLVCLVSAVIWVLTGALESAAPDEMVLAWTKAKAGQKHFDEGKALFEKGEWRAAYQSFKAARKLAKGRFTKTEVERWQIGSQGGLELETLEKMVLTGNKKKVYRRAEQRLNLLIDTPIGERFDFFVQSLQKDLFYTLEDFNRPSKRFSEKYGKSFTKERQQVKEGKYALAWNLNKGFVLKIKKAQLPDKNLSGYSAVSFWLCFPKGKSNYEVVFKGLGKSKSDYGDTMTNAFMKQMTPHSGWKRIEIPFKQFQIQGDVKWELISDFRIQFPPKKNLTVYVDYIALVK